MDVVDLRKFYIMVGESDWTSYWTSAASGQMRKAFIRLENDDKARPSRLASEARYRETVSDLLIQQPCC
jgi:hypothetical protein